MHQVQIIVKFQNPRTTPSGRKVCDPEEEERKKNYPKNSGRNVSATMPKGSTHFAWTKSAQNCPTWGVTWE